MRVAQSIVLLQELAQVRIKAVDDHMLKSHEEDHEPIRLRVLQKALLV